jgi:hypothetical protein
MWAPLGPKVKILFALLFTIIALIVQGGWQFAIVGEAGCQLEGTGCQLEGDRLPIGGGQVANWRGTGCQLEGTGCQLEGTGCQLEGTGCQLRGWEDTKWLAESQGQRGALSFGGKRHLGEWIQTSV